MITIAQALKQETSNYSSKTARGFLCSSTTARDFLCSSTTARYFYSNRITKKMFEVEHLIYNQWCS